MCITSLKLMRMILINTSHTIMASFLQPILNASKLSRSSLLKKMKSYIEELINKTLRRYRCGTIINKKIVKDIRYTVSR